MRIYLGGVAAVLAIVAIGCGSGGDSTEVALTKAQFIKRGDAICRSAQERRADAIEGWKEEAKNKGKPFEDWSPQELGPVYLEVALPPVKHALDELAALNPPAGDVKAEKLMEAFDSAVQAIEEKPTLAITEGPYVGADQLAERYGFEVCGFF